MPLLPQLANPRCSCCRRGQGGREREILTAPEEKEICGITARRRRKKGDDEDADH